ncbi:MAG: response regulator [Planctomycetota bacterium]|jgi:DNA-binding NarL/FixJ family response regulator
MTTANQTIEIMLVDDHQLVRDALRSWLEKFTDFAVVAECGTGNEVLALAERQRPDIVVLDLLLPGMSGLEVLKQLREQLPEVKVICLSMESGAEFLTRALKLGADGYLVKGGNLGELEAGIRSVVAGRKYLSSGLSEQLVKYYQEPNVESQLAKDGLTPRQRQILKLIAEGHTTKQIAAQLGLSNKTVEMHRTQLMKNLKIHEIAGLTRYAIKQGLVAP